MDIVPKPCPTQLWRAASLTYTSTLSWSLSFYPQPLLNARRRSTAGTTPAFPSLNVLGFSCYSLSTLLFYFSSTVQAQYRLRNNNEDNTVRSNDVAFAVHALLLSVITLSQFSSWLWGFERRTCRVGRGVEGLIAVSLITVAWVIFMIIAKGGDWQRHRETWAWLDLVHVVIYEAYSAGMAKDNIGLCLGIH